MNMPGEEKPNYGKGYGIFLKGAKLGIFVLAAILFVFLVIYFSKRAYNLGYETTSYKAVDTINEALEAEITITYGMTSREIGQALIDAGIIDESIEAFLIQDTLSGLHDDYVPGTYILSSSQSVDEILQIICTEEDEDDY